MFKWGAEVLKNYQEEGGECEIFYKNGELTQSS